MRWLPVLFTSLCSFIACQTFAAERDARLANLSTRTIVGTESSMLVTGFVIGGTEPKDILVRAIGPTLAAQESPMRWLTPVWNFSRRTVGRWAAMNNGRPR